MKRTLSRFLQSLTSLHQSVIYFCIAASVIIPIVLKNRLEIHISDSTRTFFNTLDSLPADSVVLISFDYTPSTEVELTPMAEGIMRHCFHKNVRVIVMCLHPEGSAISRKVLNRILPDFPTKKNGHDFVNLGFKEGDDAVIVNMGKKFHDAFPCDIDGNKLKDISLMKTVENFAQIGLVVALSTGKPGLKEWILQGQARYNAKLVGGVTAVQGVEFQPYLHSKQLKGLLTGVSAAAEYEKLLAENNIQCSDNATLAMSAQSFAHMVMILLIIFGNIGYFLTKVSLTTLSKTTPK